MQRNRLMAMDSAREYGEFGRLRVADNRISKATVNGYFGREIAGYEELGLDPNKEYMLLRDPDELANSAESFKGVPLLTEHTLDTADSPAKAERCGVVGDDVRFEFPYLVASLVVWDSDAIDGIESGEQKEISCSYKYTLDMTPGEFEGAAYDGVMRNILANHVAIVPNGRVGRDAHVNDSKPQEKIVDKDDKKEAAYDSADEAIKSVLAEKGLVGDDGEVDCDLIQSLIEALGNVADDDDKDDDKEGDKKADDEEDDEDDKDDKDSKKDKSANDSKPNRKKHYAMDAATMRRQIEKEVTGKMNNLRKAERECEPLIGIVACDSADEVYRMTLRHYNVPGADTVDNSALPYMVEMLKSQQAIKREAPVAMDARQQESFNEYFGGK